MFNPAQAQKGRQQRGAGNEGLAAMEGWGLESVL
jgi:hypothetical protein